jgi:hypothetical protein
MTFKGIECEARHVVDINCVVLSACGPIVTRVDLKKPTAPPSKRASLEAGEHRRDVVGLSKLGATAPALRVD